MNDQPILLSPPHMSQRSRDLLVDAYDSNWVAPAGPHIDALEAEFARAVGVEHAVALSSGTAALHLALLSAGVSPGDEVLCPTLTFVATANAIRYCGARPVFVDSDRHSWCVDPNLLEDELRRLATQGRRPAAVLTVDLFGQCADYSAIEPLCRAYGTPLIVDAAESLGATCRDMSAGAHGDAACFSLNGNKIITAGGGGVLVTRDARRAECARSLSTQAKDPAPHYEHSRLGFNYRMSNLLAAVARGQLEVLPDRVRARRENFADYNRRLADLDTVEWMPEAAYGQATRWLSCLTLGACRDTPSPLDVVRQMASEQIECRLLWKPMHLQPLYRDARRVGGAVAEDLFKRGLCLPSGSALSGEDRERVCRTLRRSLSSPAACAAA